MNKVMDSGMERSIRDKAGISIRISVYYHEDKIL